ncbi:MAG: WcaF family extracellular polysaccharide biosynthesis acetyltransferase [Ruminococcus flavefaciens]|nr:WcaF family extracellular polysaccharide biosynthesis acetyltransferase [Bacteroides sp.]MCM1233521.1 WcaF family extracellular polysaccharide biosynthesis acetyltransferase [Ruminococcus flavefaciens]
MNKTDLSKYDNSWYNTGCGIIKKTIWYFVNELFLNCSWNPFSSLRVRLLRLFGAKIGKGVVIKPRVNIKYPWLLSVGDYTWIGEGVWIDNLAEVNIGSNVCVSQGAMLLCGNHDYKKVTFDLMVGTIILEDGSWVGAKSVVCPGVTLHSHSILSVASVANRSLDAYCIYQGNPAVKVRERKLL